MIGTNYPKADIVVPVRRMILDPGRATQIFGIIVPAAAAQRTGGSVTGSLPLF